MFYSAEISRTNPTCFLFLVDWSQSMQGLLAGGQGKTKAESVADCINRMLYLLVLRCVWGQDVLDRFHVGVLGYGRGVAPALGGPLANRELVPIGELARNPLRVEERPQLVPNSLGEQQPQVVRTPLWFDPVAEGRTPMVQALRRARDIVGGFLDTHPTCFPPMVLNLTDGEATDGDPEIPAIELQSLSSEDGHVLLFNLHLSSRQAQPLEFPDTDRRLPSEGARRLFRMSSCLPPPMWDPARQMGVIVSANTRGFVFNGDLSSVVRFLDIGTRFAFDNLG
jgi:hypothetical protein